MDDVQFIQSLSVLEVKDGDTVVIKTKFLLTEAHVQGIERQIKNIFRDKDIKVLVLTDGMDIGVVRSGCLLRSRTCIEEN